MKRFLSLLIAMILMCSCFAVAAHAAEADTRASAFFTGYGTTLSKQGGGRIRITFSASGTTICNQIGVASWQVEKLNSSGEWVAAGSTQSGSMGSNRNTYTFSRYFNGVAGETYRVKVTFVCTINNATETKNYTSGRITAN